MKIRNESINKNYLTSSIIFTLGIATVFGIGIYNATNIANTSNANALSYSTSNDISFTFAPTLSIGLSTDSLTIDNLAPGTTSDSNKVSVTVSSNTPYGYVLSAGVGSNDTTSPYYDTSSLTHENTTISNVFSSVDTNASLDSLTTDNTWGYSTSTDGGTSWSTYSGLSHAETKPLLDISNPAAPSTIDFKIAARSASIQASGTYNNVITFYAVGKPKVMTINDLEYMQDFKDITETDRLSILSSMTEDKQYTLKDSRDDKPYYISKLKDGNIWMTQNLDLELDSAKTYTSADTDVSVNWQPIRSTIEFSNTSVSGWSDDNYTPYSASSGDVYYYTSGTTSNDSRYASLAACQTAHPDCSAHMHAGNYYNWPAAVANNNTDTGELKTQYNNAPDSICPAGWRLPTARDSVNTAVSREWNALLVAESVMTNPTGNGYATDGLNNIRISPLWLTRSGGIAGGSLAVARSGGGYWTSTISSNSGAYSLDINFGNVLPANSNNKNLGYAVRCLVK